MASPTDWRDDAWRESAACRRVDPHWFDPLDSAEVRKRGTHPAAHDRIRQAIAVCHSCPVRAACDRWADEAGVAGVLGARYRKQSAAPQRGKVTKKSARSSADVAEEARHLLKCGQPLPAVAQQLGVSVAWIKQLLGNGSRAAA